MIDKALIVDKQKIVFISDISYFVMKIKFKIIF